MQQFIHADSIREDIGLQARGEGGGQGSVHEGRWIPISTIPPIPCIPIPTPHMTVHPKPASPITYTPYNLHPLYPTPLMSVHPKPNLHPLNPNSLHT